MWISSVASEVDAVDLVDHVAQQVAADHAVDDAREHGGDHLPAAVRRRRRPGGRAGRRTGPAPRLPSGRIASSWLMKASSSAPVMPSLVAGPVAPAVGRLDGRAVALAAQRGLGLLDLLHVVEELQEHDPGEHRQAVEVAVSPLSLRMMSRADLIRLPSRWAVVSGCAVLAFLRRAIVVLRSGGVEQGLQLARRLRLSCADAAEEARRSRSRCRGGDRRHFQHVGKDELRRAVLGVLLQQLVEDRARLGAVAVEEVLCSLLRQPLGALAAGAQRRVEGEVAEQVERVGVRLLGGSSASSSKSMPRSASCAMISARAAGIGPARRAARRRCG